MSMNPSHYSFMRFCGSTLLTELQLRGGTNTYCHPRVQLGNGQLIQYETVSHGDFCYDLNHWAEMHVSGYLHKPVETVVAANSDEIANAIQNNIQNVLHVTMLLLPPEFSYHDLFTEIALCTYDGKTLTKRSKNNEKMRQMVAPKLQDYFQFYLPHLKQHFSFCLQLPDPNELSDGKIKQDKSAKTIRKHFYALPSEVFTAMGNIHGSDEVPEKIIKMYAEDPLLLASNLKSVLMQRVLNTRRAQELKDLITAAIPNQLTKVFVSGATRM